MIFKVRSYAVRPCEKLIYVLIDPTSNLVRYIGQSIRGEDRAFDHLNIAINYKKASNPHLLNWLLKIHREGLVYEVDFLERSVSSQEKLDELETFWISYFRSTGSPLLNAQDGGLGGVPSEQGRQSLRDSWTDERRANQSKMFKGRTRSSEIRAQMSQAQRNRHRTKIFVIKTMKAVICVTDNVEFRSVADAARAYNTSRATIGGVCNGLKSDFRGKIFSWKK